MILATFRDGTILRFHQECFSAWETARAVSVICPLRMDRWRITRLTDSKAVTTPV